MLEFCHDRSVTAAEYERANAEFISKVLRAEVAAHPILGRISVHVTRHETGSRSVIADTPYDFEGIDSEMRAIIDLEDVRRGRLASHDDVLQSFSKQHTETLARRMFADLATVTTASGQVVNAVGRDLDLHYFLDALELMAWRFRADGSVDREGVAFYVSPDLAERMAALEETDGHRDRLRSIEEKKRAEWFALRRERRIPRRRRG